MIGTLLGNRYELVEKIGEGGMAEVYKAKCHLLNRFVAVKILKEEFSTDIQFVDKFKREATAAASLSDNNIVDIYDVGSQEGINYIVMEYVNGKTLKEVIVENKMLSVEKSVNIAIQIAKALECAHRNNIIHRDIKPHNILVTEDDLVKVTDFGIAKASNSVTITNTSKVMGSAHYFSPEQAKGSYVDFRTDIYSLGIVMYEMVTGRLPYDGDSPVSIALKHIQEPAIPPKSINPSIPEDLNNIILKSVEKQPANRYQTIHDLIIDLKKIQNHENVNVKFANFDADRTRIMDAIKIDDTMYSNNKYNNDNVDDEEDDDDNDDEKSSVMDSGKKKIIVMITAIVLFLAIGFSSSYMLFNKFSGGSQKSVAIPNIVGMSKEDAKKLIEEKNLVFQEGGKENSDKPEGTILRCFPDVGTSVKSKSDVRVIISAGKEKISVPDLEDIDLDVAKDILKRYGFELGQVSYEYSDNVNKNYVIKQQPGKDGKLEAGGKVDLVISKGREVKYSTVPDLNGASLDKAKSSLETVGLLLGSQKSVETSDKTLDGKVFEQTVEGGTQVKQGSSVGVSYYVYKEEEKSDNKVEDKKEDASDNKEDSLDKNDNKDKDNQENNNSDSGNSNKQSGK